MNIKKMSGSLVAATLLLGLSTVVMADCDDVIYEIELKADALRCDPDPDIGWDAKNPIWQYKGTKGDGCVIHQKLAKKLNEVRTEPPPKINKKGTNFAAGAANNFRNGKYEAGQQRLQDFIDTMMYAAKAHDDQQGEEDALVEWATGIQTEAMVCRPAD